MLRKERVREGSFIIHGKKRKNGRSSPTSNQNKKDLSHFHCYICNKLGHYAQDCDSKKMKHETSIADVEKDTSQKKPKNEDRMEFFF